MAEAMDHQGVEARVAEQDLKAAAGRGVTLPDDGEVGCD
jgi:hypothetical protein